MSIFDNLPVYHQIEVNNLKGILPGFVVAQMPFKADDDLLKEKFNVVGSTSTTVGTKVANGHIVTLDTTGLRSIDTDETTVPLFITYNDPIVTFGPKRAYKLYATDITEECVRAVQLMPGDEWMSDIDYFEEVSGAKVYPGAAELAGRIIKIDNTNASAIYASDDFFANTTLADGTAAYHYMFIK